MLRRNRFRNAIRDPWKWGERFANNTCHNFVLLQKLAIAITVISSLKVNMKEKTNAHKVNNICCLV
ncbi:Uncharacterized protein APZ42_012502 [Daphnia magna]|uniref:Uncharacterized protein n=1 Tax=Daphnia magna TaxID=35525 RepID=A0A162RUY6_9CRUS|nr:Uncharacterized protein APZ42_012502 [Daphnia magna]